MLILKLRQQKTRMTEKPTSVKQYFITRGITFPVGAKIVYDNRISRLIATNTQNNLRKIEQIVDELNVIDPQVVIEAKYIKIAKKDYEHIKKAKKSSSGGTSFFKELFLSDKIEVIASATVMTQNGEEACIRMIKEEYLPESWGMGSGNLKATEIITKSKGGKTKSGKLLESLVFPEFGETAELGLSLIATPTVDPDKYTISMDVMPCMQELIGWSTVKKDQVIKMPIIKAYTAQTQTTSYDGMPVLVSSVLEDVQDKTSGIRERNYFMLFYTARLVNPDGSPLRKVDGDSNTVRSTDIDRFIKIDLDELTEEERELAKVVCESVEFKNESLFKVIKYLRNYLRKAQKEKFFSVSLPEKELKKLPAITLSLHDISMLDLLTYVCMKVELKYQINENLIDFGKYKDFSVFKTRLYKVRKALISRITIPEESEDEDFVQGEGSPTSKALKQYFSERGVLFPEGATIEYDWKAGKIKLKNTKENLRRMDTLLRCLCFETQAQVLIEINCVSILDKDLVPLLGKEVASANMFTSQQIKKIIDSKKGVLLSSQVVSAKSGEEAVARTVAEEYFPESWCEGEVGPTKDGYLHSTMSLPEYGESTDFGSRFIVTPTVSPNNYTITLSLNPQYLKLLGLRKYGWGYAIDGQQVKETIKVPKIARRDLKTNVRVYDGQTLCVGRTRYRAFPELKGRSFPSSTSWTKIQEISKSEGKELNNIFFFVSARLINPNGKFLRRKVK